MEYDENELKMVIGSCEIGYEEQLYEFIYKLFMGKLNALAQWCLKIALILRHSAKTKSSWVYGKNKEGCNPKPHYFLR